MQRWRNKREINLIVQPANAAGVAGVAGVFAGPLFLTVISAVITYLVAENQKI